MQRESLKSRLGFILLSAGCAIGIGNVWRFPYIVGNNGGGIFVLIYLFFLIAVGVPVLVMEFAVGRASRRGIISAYSYLKEGSKAWKIFGSTAVLGNYILMFFYTTVSGWMLYYFIQFARGSFNGMQAADVSGYFDSLLARPDILALFMIITVVCGFFVCSLGLQKGVEKITKAMMLSLLGLIVLLAVHSIRLAGGINGVKFYLLPDISQIKRVGFFNIVTTAMNQAFFTLSIGIGSMMIFGSYMDKSKSLLGESITISLLDTFVAIMSGLIIFPACFAFGVQPDSGPKLIFITLPNIFISMRGGRLWGTLFFLFMTFASMSTVIGVFENIMSCTTEKFNISRIKAAVINTVIVCVMSMPCVLGFNVLSGFAPLGSGTTVLDLEDFIVSAVMLPLGSLACLLFCVTRLGWGFDRFIDEANTGDGLKFPRFLRPYVTYVLPLLIAILFIQQICVLFIK